MDKKTLKKYKNLAYLSISISLLATLTNGAKQNLITPTQKPTYIKVSTEYIKNKINNSINTIKDYVNELSRETIYIGDSRTRGILESGAIDEEHTIYGIGYGYKWLIGEGKFRANKTNALTGVLNELPNKIKPNTLYNIAIWLGVNDYKYYNAETYFETFLNLALNNPEQKIYIISIGPVDENPNCPRSNKPINEFNATMRELINTSKIENLKFIDLELTKTSIKKYDYAGIHYSSADYINIQNLIETKINEDKELIMTLK